MSRSGRILALLALLSLAACSNPGGSADTARTPVATPPIEAAPVEAAPVATETSTPAPGDESTPPAPQAATPAPAQDAGAPGPVQPLPTRAIDRPAAPADAGRACATDADCAIKDGGSCCGYRPVCVNKDTPTFPEEVKARCARDGRVGICGFQAISGCQCVAGKCEGVLQSDNGLQVQ